MAWQNASGYNKRARVEGTMSRWKQVIGDELRAHTALLHQSAGWTPRPQPRLGSGDAYGVRASELQHAVEDMDGDAHLGRLAFVGM